MNKKNTSTIHNSKFILRKSVRGFTLVEMIVAVSIFTIVVFVSVGALLAIADANRKANALRTVMDNLNFAMESMARSIRTGDDYSCSGGDNCPSGGNSLTFTDQNSQTVTYRYEAATKSISVQKGAGAFTNITSPEVTIDSLTFYVNGVGSDGAQPRVVISIQGTAGIIETLKSSFSVQTTISQRRVES